MQVAQHLAHQSFAQFFVLYSCHPLAQPDASVAALARTRVELEGYSESPGVPSSALNELATVQGTVSDTYVRFASVTMPLSLN